MCLRIFTRFKGVSSRETHLWEHFGRADKFALITCLKKFNVSGTFLMWAVAFQDMLDFTNRIGDSESHNLGLWIAESKPPRQELGVSIPNFHGKSKCMQLLALATRTRVQALWKWSSTLLPHSPGRFPFCLCFWALASGRVLTTWCKSEENISRLLRRTHRNLSENPCKMS